MKNKFTLVTALRTLLLLCLGALVTQSASAQIYCTPTFYYDASSAYGGEFALVHIDDAGNPAGSTTWQVTGSYPGTTLSNYDFHLTTTFNLVAGAAPVGWNVGAYVEPEDINVYVDFNKNGNFDDPGEKIVTHGQVEQSIPSAFGSNGSYGSSSPIQVSVPGYISAGTYRMRVMNYYYYYYPATGNLSPCASYTNDATHGYGYGGSYDFTLAVSNASTCFYPAAVHINSGDLQAQTVVVNWQAPPSTTPLGYQWILVPGGASISSTPTASGTNTAANTTASVSGLTPNTGYDFYVRSWCGSGPLDTSSWFGPFSFATLNPPCGPINGGSPALALTVPSTSLTACYGSPITIAAFDPNVTVSGIVYGWQSTTNLSLPFSAISGGIGTNTTTMTTPPITADSIWIRNSAVCSYVTGASPTYGPNIKVVNGKYGIPYSEDFFTTPNGALPNCFTRNNDGASHFAVASNFTSASGAGMAAAYSPWTVNSVAPYMNSYFTSPAITMKGGTGYVVKFDYAVDNLRFPATLQVFAATPNNPGPNFSFMGSSLQAGAPILPPGGVEIFDSSIYRSTAIVTGNIHHALIHYTPAADGPEYFTWYSNTIEASASASTGIGIGNIQIYKDTACTYPTVQVTANVLSSSINTVNSVFTPPVPGANKYLVVRTYGNTPFSGSLTSGTYYTVGQALGNGTVAYANKYTTFSDQGLLPNTLYTYTYIAYNDLCTTGPLYDTVNPFHDTISTSGAKIYVWNQSVLGDFTTPTNWTPSRINKDASDILVFNNGINDTAINVPTQSITRLSIINNSTVRLRAASAGAVLTLISDGDATTSELTINTNASLFLDGNSSLKLNFSGVGATAAINGNMEMVEVAGLNQVDFTTAVGRVGANGSIAVGGPASNVGIFSTNANLFVNGTVNFKYTTTAGPRIPLATWNVGSTLAITGYTTATAVPTFGFSQQFYNVTWNCPLQTGNVSFAPVIATSNNGPLTILGTFTIASTGGGAIQLAGGGASYIWTINNYLQTGGVLDLSTTNTTSIQYLYINGTFTQTAGTVKAANTLLTSNSGVRLVFNNNSFTTRQAVTFASVPTGPINYRVTCPAGISLQGPAGAFNINGGGGIVISSPANPAISLVSPTTNITYAASAAAVTTLIYDSLASAVGPEWSAGSYAATNSPMPWNVSVAVQSGNAVVVPGNRTVPNILSLQNGDLDMGINNLTIGTSITQVGSITYGTFPGLIRVSNTSTTGGSLTRWIGTNAAPSSLAIPNTGTGYFPLAAGQASRAVTIAFSTSTATGGTITVSHTVPAGTGGLQTAGISDGIYSVDKKTYAYWDVSTGNSFNPSGLVSMDIVPGYIYQPATIANQRIVQGSGVVGTHGVDAALTVPLFYAQRTAIPFASLSSGHFYVGTSNTDYNDNVWIAIQNGNWTAGSTWNKAVPPIAGAICYINSGVTVTIDGGQGKFLANNGTLTCSTSGNTLVIDSTVINNGTVNMSAGTFSMITSAAFPTLANGITNNGYFNVAGTAVVNLGTAGGSNKPFINNGTLNVSGGTLNINGGLYCSNNSSTAPYTTGSSVFTQSGGNINVDGNANGVSGNSYSYQSYMVYFTSRNVSFTGGTMTIVDPHITGSYDFYYNGGYPIVMSPSHTLQFGDGISTTAGNGSGFQVYPVSSCLGSVVVNGPVGTTRFVSGVGGANWGVNGTLTINSGAEWRMTSSFYPYYNGNIVNNGIMDNYYWYFGNYSYGLTPYYNIPNPNQQSVTGTGIFREATSSSAPSGGYLPTCYYMYVYGAQLKLDFDCNIDYLIYFYGQSSGRASIITMANNHIMSTTTPGAFNYWYYCGWPGFSGVACYGGWVNGAIRSGYDTYTYQLGAYYGFGVANYYMYNSFPVGDSANYTPVMINNTLPATTAIGPANPGFLTVRSIPANHPSINTSRINSARTVQRYWSVTPDANIGFAPGGNVNMMFTFVPGDITPGASYANMILGHDSAGTWTYPSISNKLTGGLTYGFMGDYSFYATHPVPSTGNGVGAASGIGGTYAFGEACPPTSIILQPASQAICSGLPVQLKVGAGGLGLTYQWSKDNTPIAGATSATYLIPSAQVADVGSYTVSISGNCAAPVTSVPAVLSITPSAHVDVQPANANACVGAPATFNVTASGQSPVTYRWQKNGADVPGANSPTFTDAAAAFADAGNYRFIVTNGCASDTSATVSLSVHALPVAVITSAGSSTICQGSIAILNATSGTNYTYQWYLDGTLDPSSTSGSYNAIGQGGYTVTVTDSNGCSNTSQPDHITVIASSPDASVSQTGPSAFCAGTATVTFAAPTCTGCTFQWYNGSAIAGAVSPTYNANASGNYTVTVTNANNCTNTSAPITVAVNPVPNAAFTAGGPVSFCNGGQVTLTATPNVTGYKYYYRVNGATNAENVDPNNPVWVVNSDAGSYTVDVVSDQGCKSTSAATVINITPLPAATATASTATTFCPGGNVVLVANPGTNFSYQWYNGTTPIPSATGITYNATTAGSYSVRVNNTVCSAPSNSIAVTVDNPTTSITSTGGSAICAGSNVTINATPTTGTYQWSLNGSPITGATSNTLSASSQGTYTLTYTNANGCSALSNNVALTVIALPVVAASTSTADTFCAGGSVVLTAAGTPGVTYQWTRSGIDIPGATSATFTAGTSGTYTVTARTAVGNCPATSSPSIPVYSVAYPVPSATLFGPSNICEGNSATLYANTTLSTYTYQWQMSTGGPFTVIPGANLSTYNATSTGSYIVKVSNFGCSNAVSSPVNIVVNPKPLVTASGPVTFCWGSSVTLSVNTGNTGSPLTYEWQKDGLDIAHGGDTSITITESGVYSIKVTVVNSCTQAATPVTVTVNPLPVPVISQATATSVTTKQPYAAYQWYFKTQPINGATSRTYNFGSNQGDYTVLVTDANGCTGTSTVFTTGPVGVVNVNGKVNDVLIYPNPASSVVHVDAGQVVNVILSTVEGRVVLQQNNASVLNISELANGIYTLKVYDVDGNLLKVDKLVKNGQ